jgi:hypothetical protein
MLSRWLQQQELIDEHMTWWLMKIGLERCLLRSKNSMHILLMFLWHNNGMEFIFSSFWTFKKKLIDVILASIYTSFVLL